MREFRNLRARNSTVLQRGRISSEMGHLKTVPFLIATRKKNAAGTKDNNEILAGLKRDVLINPDNRSPLYEPLPFVSQHFRYFRDERHPEPDQRTEKAKFCKQWAIIAATRLNDYRFRSPLKSRKRAPRDKRLLG